MIQDFFAQLDVLYSLTKHLPLYIYTVSRKWFRKLIPPYRRRDEQKSPLAHIDWLHN